MNTRLLLVLPLSLLLSGCVDKVKMSGKPMTANACKTQKAWICKGEPAAPTVVLNTKNGQLKAKPGCVNAAKNTMLIFRLTPNGKNSMGSVEIVPKDKKDKWLAAKNDKFQDLIMIEVPKDLAEGNYHYGITTDTDCVDPRVRVEAPSGGPS